MGLLHHPAASLRIELDFAKRVLILGDILLQHIEHRLGLLRALINALKILYRQVLRRALADAAEQQKEVPEVHPHLDAVGVVLAVFGRLDQLNFWRGWSHGLSVAPVPPDEV